MYPLKLSAPLKDYIWGGERLKQEYGFVSASERIAEAWVLSNREDCQSAVLNGEFKGKTLVKAVLEYDGGHINLSKSDSVFVPAELEFTMTGKLKFLLAKV